MALTSNKIIVFSFTLGLMITTAAWIFVRERIGERPEDKLVYAQAPQQTIELDTDGDGLKDWEEVLWKTDPLLADTDGDGIGDLAEVEALSAASSASAEPFAFLSATATPAAELTATDKLSRQLLSAYAELRRTGTFTTENMQGVIAQLINDAASTISIVSKTYTLNDVTVTQDGGAETIARHRAQVAGILNAQTYKTLGLELVTLKEIVASNDPARTSDLAKAEKAYRAIATGLLQIPVPPQYAHTHLALIAGYTGLADATNALQKALVDPLVMLAGIELYKAHSDNLLASFEAAN